jgi:Protein of unknown function (DUF2975)
MRIKPRSPYEPFATVIGAGAALYVLAVPFGLVSAAFFGSHLYGIGDHTVCVDDDNMSIGAGTQPPWFPPGVAATSAGTSLCTNHATTAQQVMSTLTEVPSALFYGGALLLLWWFLDGAKRFGPFKAVNARRVRFIGWWLIVGGVVAESTQRVARTLLIDTLVRHSDELPWAYGLPTLTASAVLTGLGLLVVARILKVGAQMQDDLVGTV